MQNDKEILLADMKKNERPHRQNALASAITEFRESLGMTADEFSGYLGVEEEFVIQMEDGDVLIPRWMIIILECKGFYE